MNVEEFWEEGRSDVVDISEGEMRSGTSSSSDGDEFGRIGVLQHLSALIQLVCC